jgi:ADP-ribose pyrophosphatase
MPFKTLSQEYLSKHIYFTSRKESYETDTGKIVNPYFVVEMPDCAVAMPITAEGDIIFIEQYRHPIGKLCIELPGGFIDANEPKENAIARELLEETGYLFSEIIYLGKTYSNPGVLTNATHLFLTMGGIKTAQQSLDENEEIKILLKSVEEVKQMIDKNAIIQSMHELCLYKAFAYLENNI